MAARITTSAKPKLDSVVPLAARDPLVGSVLCDDMLPIFRDEVTREGGGLSLSTMLAVSTGLRAAFAVL